MKKRILSMVLSGIIAITCSVPAVASVDLQEKSINKAELAVEMTEGLYDDEKISEELTDNNTAEVIDCESVDESDVAEVTDADDESDVVEESDIEEEPVVAEDSEIIEESETYEDTEIVEEFELIEDEEDIPLNYEIENPVDETVEAAPLKGDCGDTVKYSLKKNADNTYNLTISGTGVMWDNRTLGFQEYSDSIIKIVVQEGVTSIGIRAFMGFSRLNSVTLPKGLTTIGEYSFMNCNSIKRITFPVTLKKIGKKAFSNCVSIEEIDIPKSVNEIQFQAFNYCLAMKKAIFRNKTLDFESDFLGGDTEKLNIVCYKGSTAETYAKKYSISYTYIDKKSYSGTCGSNLKWTLDAESGKLTIYGKGAMKDYTPAPKNRAPWYDRRCAIYSIECEPDVETIGNYSFLLCENLKNVKLSSNCKSIGDYAFSTCYELTKISIPGKVTSIGSHAFMWCDSMTSVSIPKGLLKMGDSAFWHCEKLKSIVIPAKLKEIPRHAFGYCKALNKVTINSGVTKIGEYAFECCSNLESIVIPDSVKVMGGSEFEDCIKLQSVTLSKNVKKLWGTFSGCRILDNVVVPKGVEEINGTFGRCTNLRKVKLPSTLKIIEEGSFYKCISLTEIKIPYGVTTIEGNHRATLGYTGAFEKCTNLRYISIPNSVTRIGQEAFGYCQSLESVVLSSKLKTIEKYAFAGCVKLSSVRIPKSVTKVEEGVFEDDESLIKVVNNSDSKVCLPKIGANKWTNKDTKKTITSIKKGTAQRTYSPSYKWPYFKNDNISVSVGKTTDCGFVNKLSKTVKYKSKDTAIATITSSGTIKGIKKGVAVITAEVDGKIFAQTVTVK